MHLECIVWVEETHWTEHFCIDCRHGLDKKESLRAQMFVDSNHARHCCYWRVEHPFSHRVGFFHLAANPLNQYGGIVSGSSCYFISFLYQSRFHLVVVLFAKEHCCYWNDMDLSSFCIVKKGSFEIITHFLLLTIKDPHSAECRCAISD